MGYIFLIALSTHLPSMTELFPATLDTPVQVVTVKFTPTKAGAVNKTITLKTDLNGGATAVIPVEAEVAEK